MASNRFLGVANRDFLHVEVVGCRIFVHLTGGQSKKSLGAMRGERWGLLWTRASLTKRLSFVERVVYSDEGSKQGKRGGMDSVQIGLNDSKRSLKTTIESRAIVIISRSTNSLISD